MSNRYEWADNEALVSWMSPEDVRYESPDGNEDGDYGIAIMTGSDGIMLYGSIEELSNLVQRIREELFKAAHHYNTTTANTRAKSHKKEDQDG